MVGCASIVNHLSIKQRLQSNASIFTAEVIAIELALDTIVESDDDHLTIFSDSLSVLLSLHKQKLDNSLIFKSFIESSLIELRSQNHSFVLGP